MRAWCAGCGKSFEVKVVDKVVMVCPECKSKEMPDVLSNLFSHFGKGGKR